MADLYIALEEANAKNLLLEEERDQLRAELGRLQRNEDCVQRLILWSAENGWNGVDNSKILDSFIIGLFDELRAELAAAKDKISVLENQKAAAEYAVAEIWNKNGPHPKLGWMPSGILQGMVERGERVVRERTALAAHVERLVAALEAARPYISVVLDEKKEWLNLENKLAITSDIEAVHTALAATPAQSLAAHDAALLERVKARLYALASKEADQPYGHDMNPRQWAATCLECAAEDVTAMQEEIQFEADRIAKEAADGQA